MIEHLEKYSNEIISMIDTKSGICISSMIMDTDDFINLCKTNAVQRFTEARLTKALKNHLRSHFPTHSTASIAALPDGTLIKLDTHTRSEAWESGYLPKPEKLMVTVYHVDNEQFSRELYNALDNRHASETASDHAYGSTRGALKRKPDNGVLFNRRGMRTALEIALNNGSSMQDDAFRKRLSHDDSRKMLEVLDKNAFKPTIFNAGFLGAVILSVLKDGENAMEFWLKVANGEGTKSNGKLDAVEMAYQFKADIDRFKTVKAVSNRPKDIEQGSSRSINYDYCMRVLPFYIAWKSNRTYQPTQNAKGWTTRTHKNIESALHFLTL